MNIDPRVATRLAQAWEGFTRVARPETVQNLEATMDKAHEQAKAVLAGERGTAVEYPELTWARTLLGGKEALNAAEFASIVSAEGVLWGFQKYEQFDPGWIEAFIEYLRYIDDRAPIGSEPQVLEVSSELRLAIAGDWGTGFWRGDQTPAIKVADQMRASAPDYTIHLGDTYYAGTAEQITNNLAQIWPQGTQGRQGNLAIPGNHEMFSGGKFYTQALPEAFPSQQQTSYVALRNRDWLVIALNTAYDATDMYQVGAISQRGGPQIEFLQRLLADLGERKVVLLSHHQPLTLTGDALTPLYHQIQQLFAAYGVMPSYWYWGHLHNAVVYDQTVLPYRGRCIGHGAIPYGVASALHGKVQWYETQNATDAEYPERVVNGFLKLELRGPHLEETFVDENGSSRWSQTT